jgi:hypothetical protein
MKIYKLFDGSYLDLDHVVVVSKLCVDGGDEDDDHGSFCFDITLMFVLEDKRVVFPYAYYKHLLSYEDFDGWRSATTDSWKKAEKLCQIRLDKFIYDWHNKEFLEPLEITQCSPF